MEYNHLVKKDRSNLRINLIVWERRTGKKVVGIPLETEKVELSFSQSKFGRRYRRFLVQAFD
jgi:hypothetical protein